MCCNGTFIVEAMLLVVMNDEIKEIVFDPDLLKKTWKPGIDIFGFNCFLTVSFF